MKCQAERGREEEEDCGCNHGKEKKKKRQVEANPGVFLERRTFYQNVNEDLGPFFACTKYFGAL